MNKMKRAFRSVAGLLAAVLFLGTTACTGAGKTVPLPAEESDAAPTLISAAPSDRVPTTIETMTRMGTKGYTAFSMNTSTGDFAVEDLRNGHVWYSTPPAAEQDTTAAGAVKFRLRSQLLLNTMKSGETTVKSKNSANSCKDPGDITAKAEGDRIVVTYHFAKEEITVPVVYTLLEDGFTAEIAAKDITEAGDNRVMSVSILPFFGAQDSSVSGEMLLPSGNGTRIAFNNKKVSAAPYRVELYGRDIVTSLEQVTNRQETLSLPVYYLEKPGNGFLAFAEKGAANAYVNACISGQSTDYNQAYYEFETRTIQTAYIGWGDSAISQKKMETTPIATGDMQVRYVLTDAGNEGSAGKAAVVRAYLTKVWRMQPQTADVAPLQLSVLGCLLKKQSILGVTVNTAEKMTSYAEALSIVQDLYTADVSRITMQYSGWSDSELHGKIVTSADSIQKLGSKKEMAALSAALEKTGGRLYLNSENTLFSKSGNGYSFNSDSIKDINKMQAEQYRYYASVFFKNYGTDPMRALAVNKTVDSLLCLSGRLTDSYPSVGIALGRTSALLYSNYSDGGMRRHQALGQLRSGLMTVSDRVPLLGENPNAYVLPFTTEVSNLPAYGTKYDIVDGDVPFYSMVLRGLRVAGSTPINQYGDYTQAFLRSVESGMALHYEVMSRASDERKGATLDSFYGAEYANVQAVMKEQYARYAPLYQATAQATIMRYVQNGNVAVTTYSNGVISMVNDGEQETQVGGYTIPARDFIWMEGEKA